MNSTRPYLRSPKLARRRRQRAIRRLVLFVLLIVAVVGGLAGLTHVDAVTINTVAVEGNQIVPAQQIAGKVEGMLDNSFLYIFSRRNILMYPSAKIEQELMTAYPRFGSVVVHAVSPTKIQVLVSERKPKSLWCKTANGNDVSVALKNEQREVSDASASSSLNADAAGSSSTNDIQQRANEAILAGQLCYFLDAEGYIFSLAPNFQGNAYLKFYGGTIGPNPIGQSLMSSTTYTDLIHLADALQGKDLKIDYITVKNKSSFNIKLQGNGELYFSNQKPFEQAFNTLLTALASEVFGGSQPSGITAKAVTPNASSSFRTQKITQFEYIDMRFGNKVFYKLKGLPAATVSATSASSTQ